MASNEPLPANMPLTLYRGDTRVWTDIIEQNTGTDAAPVWTPIDLTGHTFLSQIRAGKNREDAVVATMTVEVVDAAAGKIKRTLPSAEADKLGADGSRLFWDLQITRTSDGFRRTYLAGSVTVKGDASNG